MEPEVELMAEQCGEIRDRMSDWLQVAHSIEFLVAQSQIKLIREMEDDTTLVDASTEMYDYVNSLISNKYEGVQIHCDNFHRQLMILESTGKNSTTEFAELKFLFQAFKNAWNEVKGELQTGLWFCLQKFENILDEYTLLQGYGSEEE